MTGRPSLISRVLATTFALGAIATCAYSTSTFDFRWIDVNVYAWGGRTALDPSDLTRVLHPQLGMPFTYTPFAALVFAVLAPIGALTPVIWTSLSLLALARASWLLAQVRGAWLGAFGTAPAAVVIAAGVLATQPGTNTVRLGQVGFVLLWLVCEDLLRPARRSQGALVGLATAVKLTPGAYVLLLIVVGRVRAALVAGLVVVATIGAAWIVLPTESRSFWRYLGPDVTTIGPVTAADHWSINGTIWRIFGTGGNDVVWLAAALATLATTLVLARMWWRAGSAAGAIGLVALGSVLASPFSWSHHWVAIAPLFVAVLAEAARAHHVRTAHAAIGACYALLLTGVWWHGPRAVLRPLLADDAADATASNTFLLVAGTLIALAWWLRPVAKPSTVDASSQRPSTARGNEQVLAPTR